MAQGRSLRTARAIQQFARIIDGRTQVRAGCGNRLTGVAARGDEDHVAAGDWGVSVSGTVKFRLVAFVERESSPGKAKGRTREITAEPRVRCAYPGYMSQVFTLAA